ncbi:iron oxidase [Acidihalobacter ferrooxydans]|uniref:Iron oxidase n=1 Tax=Acidihalobacter ferrooxydans TaxID=1765967 RepID=A0A1P8UKV5_9GAMM|nr:iron oxidase [Acidihalobacter ferrooxydans]APZ44463.1 iron oxidase [Acidihalobacter ferrooxydans]
MDKTMTRREWLKLSGKLALATAVAPLAYIPLAHASSDGLVSKASVSYQDKPSGSDMCSNCRHFVPGPSKTADGTCRVVAGKISPHGYCFAYTPLSS